MPAAPIERKGAIAVTLHWRTDPAAEPPIAVSELASRHGLALLPGRMAVELRPPLPVDKGTAVEALLAGSGVARGAFAGDDHGDLAAFDALDRMVASGALEDAVRIAVRSEESPPELLDRADPSSTGPRASSTRCERSSGPRPSSWSSSQSFGVRTRRELAQPLRPAGAFVGRHRQRLVQRARGLLDVVRMHGDHGLAELVERAGLGGEAHHAVAAVDDRALLGDEVETVLDRVHEQHVVAHEPGDASAGSRRACRARPASSRTCPTAR